MKHSRPGRIESMNEHPDGKHVSINIAHGNKKKSKGGEVYSYRPSSTIHVPKAHAASYKIGQRVNAGIEPGGPSPVPPISPVAKAVRDPYAGKKGGGVKPPAPSAPPKGKAKGKGKPAAKKKGAKGKAPARGKSRIARAMDVGDHEFR